MNTTQESSTIKEIKSFFESDDTVQLAYIFGSQVEGNADPQSDYDFGILLDRKASDDNRYRIASELSGILQGAEVDVILLDNAPITLAYKIIATGERLYEQNIQTRVDCETKIMGKYGDYLPVLRQQRKDLFKECIQ